MSIVKSKHSSNYTVLPNDIFKQGLTLEAIGLLSYLLSLPHDWVIQKSTLHKQLGEGRYTFVSAFNQLCEKGYILTATSRNEKGYISYNYIVYDKPFNGEPSNTSESPISVFPKSDFPKSEKQQLQSTIIPQSTNNTTNTIDESEFYKFWNLYDKKVGNLVKLKKAFYKLSKSDIDLIMAYIPKYKLSQPNKKYRKNAETFLNNKSWNDELIDNDDRFGAPPPQKEIKYLQD